MKKDLLRTMIRIRLFEEAVATLKGRGEISGPVHSYIGQEAIATGVCLALSKDDYIIGNHRSHGHLIAKGANIRDMMVDILKGNGKSMHVSDPSVGAICSTAIVGSGLPLACGVAFASKFKKDGRITCVFFGDGAVNEGSFYESINLTSLWGLPVLFIIENNGVAVTTPLSTVSLNESLISRANPFNIYQQSVDGQDIDDVFTATRSAIISVKKNKPAIIECKTMRFGEHQEGKVYEDVKNTNYRDNKEVDRWIKYHDPIKTYSDRLIMDRIITKNEMDDIYSEEMELIKDTVSFALNTSI